MSMPAPVPTIRVERAESTRLLVDPAPAPSQAASTASQLSERVDRLNAIARSNAAISETVREAALAILRSFRAPETVKVYPSDDGAIRLLRRQGLRSASLIVGPGDQVPFETFDGESGRYLVGETSKRSAAAYLDWP